MRTLLGLGIFICLFLHFNKREEKITKIDSLSMKQSAAKVIPDKTTPAAPVVKVVEPKIEVQKTAKKNNFPEETELDTEEYTAEDMAQIPWAEIEEGWRNHLKEFLLSADPYKGEEIFSAYLGATQKYSQRVDYVEDEDMTFVEEDSSVQADPLVGLDDNSYDPEASHTNTLKDIFGDLYPQVEALHKEYVESIQYLNRSSAEISISL